MTQTTTQRRHAKSMFLVLMFAFVALAAGRASAGCLDNLLHPTMPLKSYAPSPANLGWRALPAVYRPADASGSFLRVNDFGHDDESIVGLWEFQFAGPVSDFGTQAWHSDGTELMFSGGRDPASGDICQGVWRKIGPRTYTLNHIAMGWDPGTFGIRVHIHAIVRVDRSGNSYTGRYKAYVYAVSPDNPFDESVPAAPVLPLEGTMKGTRVNPD
jgi:hypothetical protein